MISKKKGISGRLKAKYPHFFAVKDFSHLFDNFFKKELKAIPSSTTD
jgi:hypothetical protein